MLSNSKLLQAVMVRQEQAAVQASNAVAMAHSIMGSGDGISTSCWHTASCKRTDAEANQE